MQNVTLAPHEIIEIGEFINQELVGINKINLHINKIQDKELKILAKEYSSAKKLALQDLSSAISSEKSIT